MRQLWLLRHGSAEAEGVGGDADRALSAEGAAQVRRIGVQLAAARAPSLILCSPARRTRETARLLTESAGGALSGSALHVEQPLYLASARALLVRLATLDDATPAVLVVGHNPGLSDLAGRLARAGTELLQRRAKLGLGTAELVQLATAASWSDLEQAGCEVRGFLEP